jgi:hypothetical protein
LGGLSGFAVLVCLALGAKHLLETYGNRLDVEDAKVGDFIRVRARYFCVFGPPECELEAQSKEADGALLSWSNFVKREWLCLYRTDWELDPVNGPGQVTITIKRHDDPDRYNDPDWQPGMGERIIQEKIVDVK